MKNKNDIPIKNQIEGTKYAKILQQFHDYYVNVTENGKPERETLFWQLVELINKNFHHPHRFGVYNKSVRSPFDYYQFSLNLIRQLIDFEKSKVLGQENIPHIIEQLSRNENVILLANHQTEPDPQIIKLLLEKNYSQFAENIIFVAGHRVVEDPIAIPMSMGCNLLCIYSKKHIDHPPEDKAKKVSHNQRTMKKMSELLSEGGKCIYVAPSGGRDRSDKDGNVPIDPFDPQNVEMFSLIAQKSGIHTHFYPLTLLTYDIMPPPKGIEKELGELRHPQFKPAFLSFGNEIEMDKIPGLQELPKKEQRIQRSNYIWNLINQDYSKLITLKN